MCFNGAMNKLTAKQEKFCQAIADGMNQTDAYKSAYDVRNYPEKKIWVKASELANTGKVKGRIKELKEKLAKKQLWTRERSVILLGNIAHNTSERSSDRISAIKELNAMHGFNEPTKMELSVNPLVLILETDEGAN